jgi:hypothetical protein
MSLRAAALYNGSHEVESPTSVLENVMTEMSYDILKNRLAHVIAINLLCIGLFVAFCVAMTFGSLDLLLTYWNEHRAASMVVLMALIVSIPGIVEIIVSRLAR